MFSTDDVAVDYSINFNIVPDETNSEPPVNLENENVKRKLEEVTWFVEREDTVKTVKKRKFADEVLDLDCEWINCDFNSSSWDSFSWHVRGHIQDVQLKPKSPSGRTLFECGWAECGFESLVSAETVRHVNYHSVHTRLKNIGLNLINNQNLKACMLDSSQRNLLQELTEPLKCMWSECPDGEREFEHPQGFYWHVGSHADEERLDCKWNDCMKRNFASKTRMLEHLRSHTQEKRIACPTCGGLFASRVKLLDHLKRQQGSSNGFTCTHCNKTYALERLLRDHMRSLMNHYKCAECGMCWPTPSSLKTHIKYKHSEVRDYPCDFCGMQSKSLQDLKQHMRIHEGEVLSCLDGCGFVSKSNAVMKNHLLRKHMKEGPTFACHLCSKTYKRGAYLTTHLKKNHQITSTTSRFRYKQDEVTGFYKVQLIRIELQEDGLEEKENVDVDDPEPDPDYENTDSVTSFRSVTPSLRSSTHIQQLSPHVQESQDGQFVYTSSPLKQVPTPHYVLSAWSSNTPSPYPTSPTPLNTSEREEDNLALHFASNDNRYEGKKLEVDITKEQFLAHSDLTPGSSDQRMVISGSDDQPGVSSGSNDQFTVMSESHDQPGVSSGSDDQFTVMPWSSDQLTIISNDQEEVSPSDQPRVSGGRLSRSGKLLEMKRIGAQMSDLNLFLSAIGNMFPNQHSQE